MKPEDLKLMLDLEDPDAGVEVMIRSDGKVLWINVDGKCVLRICQIEVPIEINDERKAND